MPRRYRRRRRRPKARRKVDKVQNRRIKRLEQSIEKKFVQEKPIQATLSTSVVTGSGVHSLQIYRVLPTLGSPAVPPTDSIQQANALVGNTINLRYVRARMYFHNRAPIGVSARVIVFWYKQPITWSLNPPLNPNSPVAGIVTRPTWDQLLYQFVNAPAPTSSNTLTNMSTPLNRYTTESNETPISVLSDKVITFQSGDVGGMKSLTFSKAYKSMKLAYNSYRDSTQIRHSTEPVNRQLYVAVIPTPNAMGGTLSDLDFSLAREMTYTDA